MDSAEVTRQSPENGSGAAAGTPREEEGSGGGGGGEDEVASLADRLSLHSIPSIDRSEGTASPDAPAPNLAHTPPNSPKSPILSHTPPPVAPSPSTSKPSLEALGSSQSQSQSEPPSPALSSQQSGQSGPEDSRSNDDPPPPAPPPPSSDAAYHHGAYGSSPPSLYAGLGGGLYSGSHPSSGIYSGSASLGSIYGSTGPPPVPPPPLEEPGAVGGGSIHHRREHSLNSIHSIHSVNSFKEFYDKSTLNQFISTSPKLSNREMEMNRMSGLYGSIASTADYSGLTEMFTDPVEEEGMLGAALVVWCIPARWSPSSCCHHLPPAPLPFTMAASWLVSLTNNRCRTMLHAPLTLRLDVCTLAPSSLVPAHCGLWVSEVV